jgi:RNA 2',3'-cyclic 3'-phosphodiesterase
MIRLFTTLALPEDLMNRIAIMQGGVPGARWIPRDNLHVTLTFIGEVTEGSAEDIHAALSDIRSPAFDVQVKGTGSFTTGDNETTLWLGVEPSEPLLRLKAKIDTALERAGVSFSRRNYVPRITIANLHNVDTAKLAGFMQAHNLFSPAPFPVSHFMLYESRLTPKGAVYDALQAYRLQDG